MGHTIMRMRGRPITGSRKCIVHVGNVIRSAVDPSMTISFSTQSKESVHIVRRLHLLLPTDVFQSIFHVAILKDHPNHSRQYSLLLFHQWQW